MGPRRLMLWQARLIWFGIITSPLFYCAIAFVVVMQKGVPALQWSGFLLAGPPVRASILLPVAAILVPVVLALLRVLVVGPVGSRSDAPAAQGEDEEAMLERMMGRQLLFMALADLLPTLAMVYVLLLGTMPLLWLVTAESMMMLAFCFPRGPADVPDDRG